MSVDILLVVSTPRSAVHVELLVDAASRRACSVAVFLTNDGVRLASRNNLGERLSVLQHAVVCSDSWSRFVPGEQCLLTLGSQTDHSQLAGSAGQIISL